MDDLKVINLIGAPGAGKTTASLDLAAHLKKRGYNVELVPEYARTCVWWDRHRELDDQLYISAKQHHRLFMLRGQVDVLVTDSPILLGAVYKPVWMNAGGCAQAGDHFEALLLAHEERYDNKYFLINRVHPFVPQGRLQSEKESDDIKEFLAGRLNQWDRKYTEVDGDEAASVKILDSLILEGWLPRKESPVHL